MDAAGNLFGTTSSGGQFGVGTVFEIAKTAAGYASPITLHSFNGTDGAVPEGNLVADATGDLFGITISGGGERRRYGIRDRRQRLRRRAFGASHHLTKPQLSHVAERHRRAE